MSKYFKQSYNIPKYLRKIAYYLKNHQTKIVSIILIIHMLSGIHGYTMDLIYPFSKSKVAADYIKK